MRPLKDSIKELENVAKNLNSCSDSMGDVINEFNDIFRKLNLGLSCWITQSEGGNKNNWKLSLGYARVGSKWGICIKYETFEYKERLTEESCNFNDAPRNMRIDMITSIPFLVEEMIVRTNEMTTKIVKKINEATEILQELKSYESSLDM